jgi:hypothetical protein
LSILLYNQIRSRLGANCGACEAYAGKGHARTLELLSFQKESLAGAAGSNQKDMEDAQAIDSGRLQNKEKPQKRLVLGLSTKLHSEE